MSEQQETVDVEKLENLLSKLVKAADATDLSKGGIENSGTHGSGGKQGGGQGSMADAGPLDSMMIAKMAEAGIPVDTIAAFNAFMSRGEDEDEEDENEVEKSQKGAKDANALAKSFREQLGEQLGDNEEMVNVSPYLDGLTATVAERIDGLTKSLVDGQRTQAGFNRATAAAIAQMGKLAKSQAAIIEKMAAKLGVLERAPVAQPKAVTGTAQPLTKGAPGEVGSGDEQLTKSEVCSVLSYMNLEKSIKEIGGRRTFELVGLLEGGGVYDQETHAAVTGFLKGLSPAERTLAKSYH